MWQLILKVLHVNSFIGKGPLDVWRYLTSGPDAAAARQALKTNTYTTLRDAGVGLLAGTAAVIITAIGFNLYRPLEQSFMPIQMVLRSVPSDHPADRVDLRTRALVRHDHRRHRHVLPDAGEPHVGAACDSAGLGRSLPRLWREPLHDVDEGPDSEHVAHPVRGRCGLPRRSCSWARCSPSSSPRGAGLGYLMETSMASSVYNQMWAAVACR